MKISHRRFGMLVMFLLIASAVRAENPKDFTIESPTRAKAFVLSEQKGKVIVLHFLLKTECPFCLKYTHEYAKLASQDPAVLHVFLKPDTTDEIVSWAGKLSRDDLEDLPVIYRDPNAGLAKEFGIPDGYKFHGEIVHYPALVALDRTGKEMFRYVGKHNKDRMKVDDFIAKLKTVNQSPAK